MTSTTAKWRNRLQRLRSPPSHPSSPATAIGPCSISNPTSSTPPLSRPLSLSRPPSANPENHTAQQLPITVVTLNRSFLDKALNLLSKRDRATIEEHILTRTNDINSALQVAFNSAQHKQRLCEDKRWTFTFRGHTIRLRDEADNVMLWLDRFKQVGDIAVNVDPLHAGLPWAAIRLLLEVSISESRQMACLLLGLKTTLYMMKRLEAYMEYLNNLPPSTAQINFENSLAEFHALILQFLASAIQIYKRGAVARALDALWKLDGISDFEGECDKIGARAEIEASNCDRSVVGLQRKEDLNRALKELEELRGVKESVDMLSNKINLAKLPLAKGAVYDSHQDEHDERCLDDTRVDVQRQISEWADDPHGKCIFWLSGMAGTGKSTISRTVAQLFMEKGQLGASFFFKRGESDRGNASRFFTTIAAQLALKVPDLASPIAKSIELDPLISEKTLEQQFDTLILNPLANMKSIPAMASTIIIVIDALDECEGERDVRTILRLLDRIKDISLLCLRIFITSRPELPIRLGFTEMSEGTHQDLILHMIPDETLEHDISVYLKHEFTRIRVEHSKRRPQYPLPADWPGDENIETLVKLAIPLFIFASTICRFIADPRWDPKKRLKTILESHMANHASKLDRTYQPILDQLLNDQDELAKLSFAREFREVVGAIVILADPLSTVSLASLLNTPKEDIDRILDWLHSVLSIPSKDDAPVRLLHLSFRDFLLDPQKCEKSIFWVDERGIHERLAKKCLELMSMSKCLAKNICNLQSPGTPRVDIDRETFSANLPSEVQYACRYWVYHLERSKRFIRDGGQVHVFLREHFLHWLEALSLMDNVSESVAMISTLQSILENNNSTELFEFIYDAKRFVLYNRFVIEEAPLQLYSSALIFAPEQSIIRRTFLREIPSWIRRLPEVQATWNCALQTLEGHREGVTSVAFSPNGKQLVSGSNDGTIQLWDTVTGAALETIVLHGESFLFVAFSPDGKELLFLGDETCSQWDIATGATLETPVGKDDEMLVAMSPDLKWFAAMPRDELARPLRLRDAATGALLKTFECARKHRYCVGFSPNGKQFAYAREGKVLLCDGTMGAAVQTLASCGEHFYSMAFSPDSKHLASGTIDSTVYLWDTATGAALLTLQTLEDYEEISYCVAFSPDGKQLVSGGCMTIWLWEVATGAVVQIFQSWSITVYSLAFSPDGKQLVSGLANGTIHLRDLATRATGVALSSPESRKGRLHCLAISPEGEVIALAVGNTVRLWDKETRADLKILEGHRGSVHSMVFSPDGKQLASAGRYRTIIWNIMTGVAVKKLKGINGSVYSLAFSPDSKQLASGGNLAIELLDIVTGTVVRTLSKHHGLPHWCTSFSPDSKILASGGDNEIRLWDVRTGTLLQTLKGSGSLFYSIEFSPDAKQLVSVEKKAIKLWDIATGTTLQTLKFNRLTEMDLSFYSRSYDGSSIETEKRHICPTSPSPRPAPQLNLSRNIFVEEKWINRGDEKLLWLPSEYRASFAGVRGNTVALVNGPGNISIIEFNF